MNKELIITTLITSLSFPGIGQAQTIDTLQKRSRAAGIAAGFNCVKRQGNGIENKLIQLLEGEGLGIQVAWLKSEKGTKAIEVIESEVLTRDCTIRAKINQEDLNKILYPFLIDASIKHDDNTGMMNELQYLFKRAQEEDLAGETLKSLRTREKMLELADKVKITKASHGSIYMGAGKDYLTLGEYEKAVRYLAIAEELLRESLGELHQSTSLGIVFHAEAIFEGGNREKGLSKLQYWIKRLREEKESEELAEMKINAYRTLAYLQMKNADMQRLGNTAREAKRLIKEFRGKDHQSLLLILSMESISLQNNGFATRESNLKRESLYLEMIDISTKHGNILEQSRSYLNLGSTQTQLSKFDLAETSILKSLRLQEAATGKISEEYAHGLSALNILYLNSNNLSRNLATSLELKAITKKVHGKNSLEYARSLISTSNAYNLIGQHDNAFDDAIAAYELLKQDIKESQGSQETIRSAKIALRNTKKWKDPEDIIDTSDITLQAELIINKQSLSYPEAVKAGSIVTRLLSNKQFEQAYLLNKRLAKSYAKHLGEHHKDALKQKKLSADMIWIISPQTAIEELLDIENIYVRTYSEDSLGLAEFYSSLATAYWAANQRSKEDSPLRKSVFYTLKYLKETVPTLGDAQRLTAGITYGLPLDVAYTGASERSERAELAYFTHINRKGMLAEIEKANRKIQNSNTNSGSIISKIQTLNKKLSDANLEQSEAEKIKRTKENLELVLNKSLGAKATRIIEKEDIAKRIGEKSILIEFQKYWKMEMLEKDEGEFYQAYVLNPSGELTVVQLGAAEKIDALISQLRKDLQSQSSRVDISTKSLSETIFGPLQKLGVKEKTIYVTLDGSLQSIPISLVQGYLGEEIQIRLLSTSKDLIGLKSPIQKFSQKPVVVSNPTFNLELKNTSFQNQGTKLSTLRGWDGTVIWQPLPGTKKEGEQVNKLLNGLHLYEDQATSDAVLAVSSPKILHIATHGFYYPPLRQNESKNPLSTPKYNQLDSPLIRSGIVLAGANNSANARGDDGILTALELLSLNLDATKLVILSACDTGRGDNVSGEGLFGLQRALKIAGARSTILSLWQVDDTATAAFMKYFYEQINKGIGTNQSLFNTQSYFKNHPIPAWRHPFYWSAFQLIGDWRPID